MKNCQSIAAEESSRKREDGRWKMGGADGLSTRGAIEDCGPFDPPSRSGESGAHGVARPTAAAVLSSCALVATLLLALIPVSSECAEKTVTLLNVSYDPTREFYQDYNPVFSRYWQAKTGEKVAVKQSHGGSGKQARSVIDGCDRRKERVASERLAKAAAQQQLAVHLDHPLPCAEGEPESH